jgi:hypothetical protein
MKLKTMAMTGVMSLAGLGLVGAGAHAVFTTSTTSAQTITAGNMSVAESAPSATCTGWDAYDSCTTLSLAAFGPANSNFVSGPTTVTFTNEGTVTPYEVSVAFGDTVGATTADTTLASEVYACITSDGAILENGLLSSLVGYSFRWYALPNTGGTTDEDTFTYYSGSGATECGGEAVGATPLSTPASNPAAVTAGGLTNLAEDGVIAPSFTLSFQG